MILNKFYWQGELLLSLLSLFFLTLHTRVAIVRVNVSLVKVKIHTQIFQRVYGKALEILLSLKQQNIKRFERQ
jgi:hypothetical protein